MPAAILIALVRGGTIVFYEFLTLIEHEGSLVLKLKHFNADLTGWKRRTGTSRCSCSRPGRPSCGSTG